MSKYLGLFVSEAVEHLEALGRDLIQLEQAPGQAPVDSLFRHAHSLKGMAASMGFESVATLAHRVEDVVEVVREDLSRLDRPLVDLLLASADALMGQVREVERGDAPTDAPELIEALGERLMALAGRAPQRTRVAEAFVQAPGSGSPVPPGMRPARPAGEASAKSPGAAEGVGASSVPEAGVPFGAEAAHQELASAGAALPSAASQPASPAPEGAPRPKAQNTSGAEKDGQVPAAASPPDVSGATDAPRGGVPASSLDAAGAPDGQKGDASASAQVVAGASDPRGPSTSPASERGGAAPSQETGGGAPAIAAKAPSGETAPSAEGAAPSARALGQPVRAVMELEIASSCQVPGVRAFLVHRRLSALGKVVALRPPLEELKAGRLREGRFEVELETTSPEPAIREALGKVAEVEVRNLTMGGVRPIVGIAPRSVAVVAPVDPTASNGARRSEADESNRTVRIRTELLDYFLDTVGELLIATAHLREVGKGIPEAHRPPLDEGVDRLHGLVKDLHDKVMGARMTPFALLAERLPRAARDIARKTGREVELELLGTDVELDRAILDELGDPLLHLLRNCIHHGIETPEERVAAGKPQAGKIVLRVTRERDRVVVELEDDGRGMSAERLRASAIARGALTPEAAAGLTDAEAFLLCCLPGVSTAEDVTDISGRGVGMDAVKRAVEGVGGALEIASLAGHGTRFVLRLPLTVAVVQLLLVGVGEEIYGLPVAKVLGAVEVDPEHLSSSRDQPLLPHGMGLLPVHRLSGLLEVPEGPQTPGVRPFVIMEADGGKVALAVERLLGQEEVVLKALTRPLDGIPGLAGATILGSGRPIFILDVPRLLAA
ncbi:MAG TPA: chemotaxis protein CheA [Myxococcaceae bacterium]|nr:chemotaxis protein CheA [Myxococcaceae bacterium]